jgi:hypothetical protein
LSRFGLFEQGLVVVEAALGGGGQGQAEQAERGLAFSFLRSCLVVGIYYFTGDLPLSFQQYRVAREPRQYAVGLLIKPQGEFEII